MRIYRLIVFVLSPFVAIWLVLRLMAGKESRTSLGERLALGISRNPPGPLVWLHGASLGELTAARPFIEHLLDSRPNLHVLVTANSIAGRDMVAQWKIARISVQLAPLDSPSIIARFLDRWRPKIAFTLENEIWPTRIVACANSGIPFVVLGARISAKSLRSWQRWPGLANPIMASLTALAPMDAENAARFVELGVSPEKISPVVNLKSSVRLAHPDAKTLQGLEKYFQRSTTILAASTHPGEEDLILSAFSKALETTPQLRLILAPRHPKRAQQIAKLIQQRRLGFSQRTLDGKIDINNPVYLADTIGEMSLWYSLSTATFVGGSLVEKGGHTPIEPAQFQSAILHGPHVSNHKLAYMALAACNAAITVTTAVELTSAILQMTANGAAAKIAKRADTALQDMTPNNPTPARLLAQLDDLSGGKLFSALLD
ncbi:MAG: glycosyltransferase N-terminal domain-containing protein [Paracoccaceae bacterium]